MIIWYKQESRAYKADCLILRPVRSDHNTFERVGMGSFSDYDFDGWKLADMAIMETFTLSDNNSMELGLLSSFHYERMQFMLLCSCGSLSQNDRELSTKWRTCGIFIQLLERNGKGIY